MDNVDNEFKSLPMVALRGMTIMPEMVVHFDVSRERSVAAVQQAMVEDQKIFLVAQKSIETENPAQEDVFEVGTIGTIKQIIKLPKHIVRVLVSGESRGILKRIEETDPYLRAEVEEIDESGITIPDDLNGEAMERGLKDMLVDYAADMRDRGCTMEETEKWVMENRKNVHHQFYSTQLEHYRRSGRMTGATAMIATILGICPIMRLDDRGRIIAYSKARGKANAIRTTVDTMEKHAKGGRDYSGKCWICHSRCPEDAERTKKAVAERFPHIDGDIRICDIGTIIASHCGPGTVAVFFLGDERAPEKSK